MIVTDDGERDVDIVLVILDLVRKSAPTVTPDQTRDIEQAVRAQYGGMRARIAKRKTHKTQEQREQVAQDVRVVQDTLAKYQAKAPIDQIAESSGIHRSTLYRLLKRRSI